MKQLPLDILDAFKTVETGRVDEALRLALGRLNRKIVVLDDDPTGAQTVQGVSVYTRWDKEAITAGFREPASLFFILTNSRGLTRAETIRIHTDIGATLAAVAGETGKDYILISRSDSTLRGHFPAETAALKASIEACSAKRFDAEILVPFFKEGGRFTIGNIHYVREGDLLTPAGQTEFAKDRSFGYLSSQLGEYVEEKTAGQFKKADCLYISLEDIRNEQIESITRQLLSAGHFNKVIVNAVDYVDIKIFALAFIAAVLQGKTFLFRSAAAVPKVLGGIADAPLLTREQLMDQGAANGGLIVVGSHVNKTTRQFEALQQCRKVPAFIEFDQHLVVRENGLRDETARVAAEAERQIRNGQTVVVYTRRQRFDPGSEDKEAQLQVSVRISDAVAGVVGRLAVRPGFIIAKGGITSSDIAIKGLGIQRARVMGQIKPGVPVWQTGGESRFPGLPYIIFPGNVGDTNTLTEIVDLLS